MMTETIEFVKFVKLVAEGGSMSPLVSLLVCAVGMFIYRLRIASFISQAVSDGVKKAFSDMGVTSKHLQEAVSEASEEKKSNGVDSETIH